MRLEYLDVLSGYTNAISAFRDLWLEVTNHIAQMSDELLLNLFECAISKKKGIIFSYRQRRHICYSIL
jgi:hypothetical protein